MTNDRTALLQLKKSLVHNGRRLRFFRDYTVDGEDACFELFVTRLAEKRAYHVGCYDFLEKFVDVRDNYFRYENLTFDTFEQAVEFVEENLGISLHELR